MAKILKRGETFFIKLFFDDELAEGEFPRVYLLGPDASIVATDSTINPESWKGCAFYLKGMIPDDAAPGVYEIEKVDVLYSITGMADAEKRRTISRERLQPSAIIVDRPEGSVTVTPSVFHVE